MVSIPSPQPQIQEQQLRKRIAALEAEIRRLRPFEQQVLFENTLFANPHLSPTHRLTLRECLFGKQKVSVNELSKVYIPAIAEKIGLSAKTTGKSLQFLALTGAIRRETETKTNEHGERVTRVFLGLTEQISHPETIKPPTKRNHGGKRYCKDCGSDNLIEQTTITCMDCGAEQHKSRRLINLKTKTTDTQLDPRYTDDQHIDHIDDDGTNGTHDHDGTNAQDTDEVTLGIAHITQGIAPTTMHNHHDDHNGHGTPGTTIINGTHDHADHHIALDSIPPIDNLTPLKTKKEPTDNLTLGLEKPPTPPVEAVASPVTMPAILPMQAMKERPQSAMPTGRQAMQTMKERPRPAEQETERDLDQETAQLLLDMAGDTQEHIVMNTNPRHPKKYLTVKRPLTLEDIRQHLLGTKTVGSTLTRHDGTTHTLCFDGDDDRVWQALTTSAQLLIATGYRPLLEPSPAGRGGHLWIIFTERVNAKAAYTQVCAIAPVLKDCEEYWPSTGNQKVRLPAGKYVTPTFTAWTHLYDAHGDDLPVSALLTHQTPAELIPASDTAEPKPAVFEAHRRNHDERSITKTEHGGVDAYHRSKYGKHEMWVEWPTEQYLIDRFNAQHTIDELATRERSGMINASTIGRPERTASVGVTKDGQHFTDFGAGAKQRDGRQDGGDAFEFYIRSHHLNKSDVLRELGQALSKEASQELLRAARAGELPPAWVMDMLTDKGREVYNENATRHGHKTLEDHHIAGDRETVTTTPDITVQDTTAQDITIQDTTAPDTPVSETHRGVGGFSEIEGAEQQETRLPWQVEEQEEEKQGIPEDFTTGTPCEQCGCCLYRDMQGVVACVRCYPPRGYHNYSNLIDERYPRVKRFRL